MVEAKLQWHFKTCPTILSNMSEVEIFREFAKLKYCIEEENKAYKKLDKK
tara:strand:+ start:508 stop:657 length:150 start_codon:yes stop_codon:yes gene_type:complete